MNVTALLSFYDENPDHLSGMVESLTLASVDRLVAVDGAYRLFPDAEASSAPACHDALRTATSEAGMSLTLHVPAEPWHGNEVEKRTALFQFGHALSEPYDDWLLVVDADETITSAGDYRAALEATSLDVASVLHGEPSVRPRWERRLYRAHPKGIRVDRAHYHYRNGDGDVLWGPRQVDREPLEQFQILHRPLLRSRERNKRRNRYYEERLLTLAEPEIV